MELLKAIHQRRAVRDFSDAGITPAMVHELRRAAVQAPSAQNLLLAAHGLGLGACPVGFARSWFNRAEVKAELGIPSQYTPLLPVVVGHPAPPPPPVPRNEVGIACRHWDD